MAIILVTGLPGHGKTLWLLNRLKKIHEAPPVGEARPVYHAQGEPRAELRGNPKGIPGLVLPWEIFKPDEWMKLPQNAIAVCDEAQFIFPVRQGRSEPPAWIAELATHRHLGIDLYVLTQHPSFLDPFVRNLCDQHFHVRRKFGTHYATVFESASGVRLNIDKSQKDLIRHEWKYPKDVFELYQSAEAHTVKRRLPMRVYVMLAAPVVFLALGWLAYSRLNPDAQGERIREAAVKAGASPASAAAPGQVDGPVHVPGPPSRRDVQAQWISDFRPRVAGLPHTAPAYDELTRPAEAPYPAYCVSLGPAYPCKCYTQRGTGLAVPLATCESIARDGFFAYWTQERERTQRAHDASVHRGEAKSTAWAPESPRGTGATAPVSRAAVSSDQAPQGLAAPPQDSAGG